MDDDTLPHHEYVVRTNHPARHMFTMLSLAILELPLGMLGGGGSQACFCEGIHSYSLRFKINVTFGHKLRYEIRVTFGEISLKVRQMN